MVERGALIVPLFLRGGEGGEFVISRMEVFALRECELSGGSIG